MGKTTNMGQPEIMALPENGALPVITAQQAWCCENGCGTCTPVQIDFEYSRTESPDGVVLESLTEKVWRSACCRAELMLWDEAKQDFVPWEPVAAFRPYSPDADSTRGPFPLGLDYGRMGC